MLVGVRNMGHTSKINNRRWPILITILFLSLTLLGCGGGGGSVNNTTSSNVAIASVSKCSSEHYGTMHDGSSHDDDSDFGSHCGDSSTFTVSTSAGPNGSISPSSANVNKGDTASFTVTPNTGYLIDSVNGCGGSLAGNTYTTGFISADCTVAATFIRDSSGGGPVTFTVSTLAGAHGAISPVGAVINEGDTASFTITPDTGYLIDSVGGCGGSLSGNTYTTGPISADCTVATTFISNNTGGGPATIIVSTSAGAHGTISPVGVIVTQGDTANFTIMPDTGYLIDSVGGCGGSLAGNTYTTGIISADCTVAATFIRDSSGGGPVTFTVSTSAGAHGAISPVGVIVYQGDTASLTITPDTGYLIDSVGGCGGSLSGNTYTTAPISADCTVAATFISDNSSASFSVSTIAGTHGIITPDGSIVNQGDTINFTITPDTGYLIDSVSGCGGSLSGNTYTTGAITAECTVTASFISDNSTSGTCTPPTTTGTPWLYPCEISVAKAYNTVFLTDAAGGIPYDEASQEGLAALIADHTAAEPQTNWTGWQSTTSIQNTLTDVTNVSVLIAETSNPHTFGIKVGTTLIPIYTTGTWTSPSRGWINDPMGTPTTDPVTGQLISDWNTGIVSIPDLLTANNLPADSVFTFYVTNAAGNPINMDISNTHRIENNGTYNSGFLLAYEDGTDADYNDITIYVNGPRSAPGGCMGHKPTILGTPNADLMLTGTLGDDVIMTFGGNDIIYARLGNDLICPGDGSDMVFAGGGNDTIFDDLGRNMIFGDTGDDTIYGGKGKDNIFGGAGNDTIYGGGGGDVIYGDAGNDTIFAGGDKDVVLGMSGNDQIHGGDGNDRIFGNGGNDALYGDGGDDRIYGGSGTNTIDGGAGVNYCAPPWPGDSSTYVNCQ